MAKTQEEITQDSVLLSKFLNCPKVGVHKTDKYGYHQCEDGFEVVSAINMKPHPEDSRHYFRHDQLLYNSSWDWLIPAIQKIGKDLNWSLIMAPGYMYFVDERGCNPTEFCDGSGYFGGVSEVFDYVVEFLKWYNKNK